MINYSVDNFIRITVDVEPKNDKLSRRLYCEWLDQVLDNNVYTRYGSQGPSGFVTYVDSNYEAAARSWLAENIKESGNDVE